MPTPRSASTTKVLLGLSGNMLSSVVGALLRHQGYQVLGLHFQTTEFLRTEAERIARKLGITLVVQDAAAAFEEHVTDHIVHQTLAGRQPEPAWMAHQKILVEGLLAKARELDCAMVASGHSARAMLDPSTGLTRLVRATDLEHDQSHLLFALRSTELMQFIFPAGDLGSAAVERLAIELELDPEKIGKPSPGFCTVSQEQFLSIAEPRIAPTMKIPGQLKTLDGSVVGEHDGIFRYQRGQALPQLKAKGEGMVVIGMVHGTHTLIIGPEENLHTKEVNLHRVNWIQKIDPIKGFACELRLGPGALAKARVTPFEHGYAHVEFEQPQRNILPDQAVAFYRGDEVLGGGFVA